MKTLADYIRFVNETEKGLGNAQAPVEGSERQSVIPVSTPVLAPGAEPDTGRHQSHESQQ